MGYLIALLVVLALMVVRSRFTKLTIFEYERAVKYRKGKFDKVLGPGVHWFLSSSSVVSRLDVRPRFVSINGQEMLTSDGVSLKVSVAAQFEITDPQLALNKAQDYHQALHLINQLALREVVGQATIDEVLAGRQQFGERLLELTRPQAAELGLNLMSVVVKDIMFPGELKKIFAQVVQAKQEGLASLERARGETAALRNLANAARLAGENPALLQLRLLQQLGASSGNSVILGFPLNGSQPVPVVAGSAKGVPETAGGTAAGE